VIDNRHRLRPERIVNGRASLIQDIKNIFISLWKGLVYVFCCMYCRTQRKNQYDLVNGQADDEDDDQTEDQSRPLLNN
jgi:hypothetical protein